MLDLSGVHSAYGPIEVLKDVTLAVREGEIVALIGANGAGKTTTLMAVSAIHKIKAGEILFNGRSIADAAPHEIVRLGISQVPEGRRIFPRMSVEENLEMGAYARNSDLEIRKDLEHVFQLFPILKERRRQLGGTLSGGEQQMLAIGRALMARPKLLLLDEPSLGLAPKIVSQIFSVIKNLNAEGVTILLVEQNAFAALKLAHRAYVLETGRVVLSGEAAGLLTNPQVRKSYLGIN
ncbi:MAG: ABC transporter ATP-binding protein [Elusimicrobia bacterium RIFCSPLOWO2_12_FULL_59_9]|nr:MAG: ABC transporter ATP-binding protein [Elusimicrobia bacterium RIFCSPLOWO2_12_FULL_59_9]